jgi:C-terminal processing protease CtpA/Prc
MSAPRHLWSGDWRIESSAHRDELAANRARTVAPDDSERPAPPPPRRTRTVRERMQAVVARMRTLLGRLRRLPLGTRRQRRIALVAIAATLLLAGAAYAVTSAVVGGSVNPTPAVASGSGAWLGINVASTQQGGVMVVDVFPGSPAQAAGMEPGDVITQINGRQILTPSDVRAAIAGMHPGDQVQLQFQGSGTSYTAKVPLASPPAGYP